MRGLAVFMWFALFSLLAITSDVSMADSNGRAYMSCAPPSPVRVLFDELQAMRFGVQPFKNGTVSVIGQLAPTADSTDQTGFYIIRDMIGKEVVISPTDMSQRALSTLAGQEFTCIVKRDPASDADFEEVFDLPDEDLR